MTDRKPEVTAEHREEAARVLKQQFGNWREDIPLVAQALAAAEQRGFDLGRADAWIPVGDIPLAPGSYLGFDRFYNRVGECESDGKGRLQFVDSQKDDCDITHWQPLPAPPKVTP